jgi:hypothetical protein
MTSVLKPQAPFERLKLSNTNPEVALKKAVILQAIIDASNTSASKSAIKSAKSATKWLFGNSEGFLETCSDAEMDPDFLIKVAKQLIELQSKKNLKPISRFSKKNTLNNDLDNEESETSEATYL